MKLEKREKRAVSKVAEDCTNSLVASGSRKGAASSS